MSSETCCKACHLPVNEDKLYGLGEYRWHMDCFKCSKCEKNLSGETNLLAIGEGTLLCSNCNYRCAICHNKITDMAVLTTEQAFCASCFKCRNCHQQIEDLQYAKTSHGIFCMKCHSLLLERKRQRKAEKQAKIDSLNIEVPKEENAALAANFNEQIPITSPPATPSNSRGATPSHSRSVSGELLKEVPKEQNLQRTSNFQAASPAPSSESEKSDYNTNFRNYQVTETKRLKPAIHVNDSIDLAANSSEDGLMKNKKPVTNNSTTSIDSTGTGDRKFKIPRKQLAPSAFVDENKDLEAPNFNPADYSADTSANDSLPSLLAPETSSTSSIPQPNGQATANLGKSQGIRRTSGMVSPIPSPQTAPPPPPTGDLNLNVNGGDKLDKPFDKGVDKVKSYGPNTDVPFLRANSDTFSSKGHGHTPSDPSISIRSISSPNQRTFQPNHFEVQRTPNSRANHEPGSPSSNVAKSPISKFLSLHKTSGSSKPNSPGGLQISSPINLHQRSNSETSINDENIDLREMYLSERRRAEEVTHKLQSMITAYGDLEVILGETRKLREINKLLTQRNTQLQDMNIELEKLTLEKFGPNTQWGSQNPPPTNDSSQQPAEGFGPNKGRSFVTVLNEPEPPSTSTSSSKSKSKNWLFRRPHKSTNNSSNNGAVSGQYYSNGQYFSGSTSVNSENNDSMNSVTVISSPESTHAFVENSIKSGAYGGPGGMALQPPQSFESLSVKTQTEGTLVPHFVTRCIAEIEKRGLDVEGIYRKPGSKLQVDELLLQFSTGGDPKVGEDLISNGEVQAITSALKQYLRKLAEPVITYECYDSFIAAGSSHNMEVLMKSISSLPPENFETLRVVMAHLKLVIEHESSNLMNTKNLAMVFAPTIARDLTGEREIPDMQARNDATHMLITNQASILDPNVREIL